MINGGFLPIGGGGFLMSAGMVVQSLQVSGPITGASGDTLSNSSAGFWTAPGFIASVPGNGFRGSGAFDITGAASQLNLAIGNQNAYIMRRGDALATTDATPTSFTSTDYPSGSGDLILAIAQITVEDSLAVGKTMWVSETWENNAGTLTRRGVQTVIHNAGDAGVATASVQFIAVGATLRLQFTGIVGTTIDVTKAIVQYILG